MAIKKEISLDGWTGFLVAQQSCKHFNSLVFFILAIRVCVKCLMVILTFISLMIKCLVCFLVFLCPLNILFTKAICPFYIWLFYWSLENSLQFHVFFLRNIFLIFFILWVYYPWFVTCWLISQYFLMMSWIILERIQFIIFFSFLVMFSTYQDIFVKLKVYFPLLPFPLPFFCCSLLFLSLLFSDKVQWSFNRDCPGYLDQFWNS